MADPQKPTTPAAAVPTGAANDSPAKTVLTPAEAELERLKGDNWADFLYDPTIARKSADAEIEGIARRAIDWKKTRGVYPWEEPRTKEDEAIDAQYAGWLTEGHEERANEFLGKVKEAVGRLEGQKKTDGRGGR